MWQGMGHECDNNNNEQDQDTQDRTTPAQRTGTCQNSRLPRLRASSTPIIIIIIIIILILSAQQVSLDAGGRDSRSSRIIFFG